MGSLPSLVEIIRLKKPVGVAGSAVPAILIGLFASFGGILFGYDTGTIGGILEMLHWRDTFSTGYINPNDGLRDINASQKSLVVSILSAGTFFGALSAAPAGDTIGRRWSLIVACWIFNLGVVMQTASTAIPLFVAGRFFAGYGVGMISTLVPLYQSETAPKWIRGFIVGAYQFAITLGLLLAAIIDNATKGRADSGSYRIPIAVQFTWSLILFGGMLILPETPRYLIKRGKHEAAARSLAQLRRLSVDSPHLVELSEIAQYHEHELNLGGTSYLDCFKGNLGKRLATGCLLQALQQLTGVNFVFYYGTSFFHLSGMGNAFLMTLIANIVNVVSTIPGLYLVEKWGRRPLLLFGAAGMAVCQFIVAIVGTVHPQQAAQNKLVITFICLHIFFFASSWGPVTWLLPAEIFPLKVRAKSLSMSTASNWLVNWAISYAIPYLTDSGPGNANLHVKVFYIWAGCCVLCFLFVWFMIYETQGLSLEQVDELYSSVSKAWESKYFVPSAALRKTSPWSGSKPLSQSHDGRSSHVEATRSSTPASHVGVAVTAPPSDYELEDQSRFYSGDSRCTDSESVLILQDGR